MKFYKFTLAYTVDGYYTNDCMNAETEKNFNECGFSVFSAGHLEIVDRVIPTFVEDVILVVKSEDKDNLEENVLASKSGAVVLDISKPIALYRDTEFTENDIISTNRLDLNIILETMSKEFADYIQNGASAYTALSMVESTLHGSLGETVSEFSDPSGVLRRSISRTHEILDRVVKDDSGSSKLALLISVLDRVLTKMSSAY